MDAFIREGLISLRTPGDTQRDETYLLTDRGRAYVDVLQLVPLPIRKWVMLIIMEFGVTEPQRKLPDECDWCMKLIWPDKQLRVPIGIFCSDECATLFAEAVEVGDLEVRRTGEK